MHNNRVVPTIIFGFVFILAVSAVSAKSDADAVVPEEKLSPNPFTDVEPTGDVDVTMNFEDVSTEMTTNKNVLEGPIDDDTDMPHGEHDLANKNLNSNNSQGLNRLTGGPHYESKTIEHGNVVHPYSDEDAKLSPDGHYYIGASRRRVGAGFGRRRRSDPAVNGTKISPVEEKEEAAADIEKISPDPVKEEEEDEGGDDAPLPDITKLSNDLLKKASACEDKKCIMHGGNIMPFYIKDSCEALAKDAKFVFTDKLGLGCYGECLKKEGGSYTWDNRGECAPVTAAPTPAPTNHCLQKKCILHGGNVMPFYVKESCEALASDAKFVFTNKEGCYGECLKIQGGSYTWDNRGECTPTAAPTVAPTEPACKLPSACKFPFQYYHVEFDGCTTATSTGGKTSGWCATEVDAAGEYVSGKYAKCACPPVEGKEGYKLLIRVLTDSEKYSETNMAMKMTVIGSLGKYEGKLQTDNKNGASYVDIHYPPADIGEVQSVKVEATTTNAWKVMKFEAKSGDRDYVRLGCDNLWLQKAGTFYTAIYSLPYMNDYTFKASAASDCKVPWPASWGPKTANKGCFCKLSGSSGTCGLNGEKYNWCYTRDDCEGAGKGWDKCTPAELSLSQNPFPSMLENGSRGKGKGSGSGKGKGKAKGKGSGSGKGKGKASSRQARGS